MFAFRICITFRIGSRKNSILEENLFDGSVKHCCHPLPSEAEFRSRYQLMMFTRKICSTSGNKKKISTCVIRVIYKRGWSRGCWLSAVNKIESTPPVLYPTPLSPLFQNMYRCTFHVFAYPRFLVAILCYRKCMSDIESIFICHPVVTRLRAAIAWKFRFTLIKRNTCVARISRLLRKRFLKRHQLSFVKFRSILWLLSKHGNNDRTHDFTGNNCTAMLRAINFSLVYD